MAGSKGSLCRNCYRRQPSPRSSVVIRFTVEDKAEFGELHVDEEGTEEGKKKRHLMTEGRVVKNNWEISYL